MKGSCLSDAGHLSPYPQGLLRIDIKSTSGEGWEEAYRYLVGQHARDILESLPARVRTSDWREDRREDEPSYTSGK
jgi:hypothetical protein